MAELRRLGWQRNVSAGAVPANATGESLPWFSYAAIAWLDRVVRPQHRVFEYGAGASTEWWAARAQEVCAVEHDRSWAAEIRTPGNARIELVECAGDYWTSERTAEPYVETIGSGAPWDIVVVDGVARIQATIAAMQHTTAAGLVVLDDTDLEPLLPAVSALSDAGYGRIDFFGFRPGMGLSTCTSVFSRQLNDWGRLAAVKAVSPGRHRLM